MKKAVKFLVLLLIIAVCSWASLQYVKRGNVTNSEFLSYYGNVEIRRVNMSFRVGGRLEDVLVEEGNSLKKGQAFARLDCSLFEVEVKLAQSARDQAEAALEQAKAELAKAIAGPRKQEIDEARALVEEYKAVSLLAETDLARNQNLIGKNAVSQSGLDSALSTRDVATSRLVRAEASLSLLEEGTRQEDLDSARAAVTQAEAALTQAEATLERARISLADTELLAPNDGILLTRVVEPGAMVSAGQTVATLSLRDVVWAYIFLEEPDLGKVAPGMKVEISTDSSKKVYSGHIGYISPEAEFTPKTVETPNLRTNLVYRARVVVETPDLGLRQGAPVDVKIPLLNKSTLYDSDLSKGVRE